MSVLLTDTAASSILSYLALPLTYEPNPSAEPLDFLKKHFRELPTHLLKLFSTSTSPRERTTVPAIRNRRLKYADTRPSELSLVNAKSTWPALWEGYERPGVEQNQEEREWAEKKFLGGDTKQHVGRLGALLGDFEEEREFVRVRTARRERAEYIESLPEEDEDSDEDGDEDAPPPPEIPLVEREMMFLRVIRERFIYGHLESIDYDLVDWDERWDGDSDRDAEERWFDDEEED
ncbi:uncharacterized protein BXZ73DRAFT_93163 [Epithele typhae]|uniref:uncharacterized protein n=1 Tax=Epithele typhae TaxID=378194 RepID=UPI002008DEAC|nr:uncharacterized protein BXZ73DRAFT_93163 [Epithele typhae]KAH9912621.1 hypothetical protein BXZ73DRAFT_93163 [Epithele typhae]